VRVLGLLALLGACYGEGAVTPCTLTCENASCPGDLVCGSDFVCQTPGMPLCTTIQPMSGPIYVKAPNADAGDLFGYSISLSADGVWLVVGAPAEDSNTFGIVLPSSDNSKESAGAVYIYKWNGSTYDFTTYMKSPDPDNGDAFGKSVAISANGNVIAVGAPGEDGNGTDLGGSPSSNATLESGAVFVFERTGPAAPWTQTRYLKAPTPKSSGGFGESVALSADGKRLAVGQPGNHEAYRYAFSPTFTGVNVMAASSVDSDEVGGHVALSGDGEVLFAGAVFEDGPGTGCTGDPSQNSALDAGAVFIMFQNGAQHAYCKGSNTEAGDRVGRSIATSLGAEFYALGAPNEDSTGNSQLEAGAVYVFERMGGGFWTEQGLGNGYVKASNPGPDDNFGQSVALTADASFLVVGASGEDSGKADDPSDNSAPGSGAVYTFAKTAASWQLVAYLKASTITASDQLGFTVAVSDDHAVVASGATGDGSGAGAVYVFR
jgi:hypothetical protein